jgi:hypothetical protein
MPGRALASFLNAPIRDYVAFSPTDHRKMMRVLRPCDVILVEGDRRISTAIKYLTQSCWSHAALYLGPAYLKPKAGEPADTDKLIVEADVEKGVIAVPLSSYRGLNVRICRPVNLTAEDERAVCEYALSRLGNQYDLKNIIDLARYLWPMPPVPMRFRRHMLSVGSGDPTRAICSTLVAQCFTAISYPILPKVHRYMVADESSLEKIEREILHIRHYSLYVPRDFDVSPYFRIVKPTCEVGFDYKKLEWEVTSLSGNMDDTS